MPIALVTGVLGQDGSLLAESLLQKGYRVIGVARPGASHAIEGLELVGLDLARPSSQSWAQELVRHFAPDEIYHLAACHRSSEPGHGDDPEQQQRMVEVNTSAALALAHAILHRGEGSLVLAGSSQMYTARTPATRIDEATPFDPSTFYGVTKVASLEAVRWLRKNQGLRGSTAILFNHESPRRAATFVSRKISSGAARIAAGLAQTLELSDLSSSVDFSAASDVVAGLHTMATARQHDERVFASGELHTIEALCDVAFRCVGLDWREHVTSSQSAGARPSLVGDPSRAEQELGWKRQKSFASWISEMVEADRSQTVPR